MDWTSYSRLQSTQSILINFITAHFFTCAAPSHWRRRHRRPSAIFGPNTDPVRPKSGNAIARWMRVIMNSWKAKEITKARAAWPHQYYCIIFGDTWDMLCRSAHRTAKVNWINANDWLHFAFCTPLADTERTHTRISAPGRFIRVLQRRRRDGTRLNSSALLKGKKPLP